MQSRIIFFSSLIIIFLILDLYVFQSIKSTSQHLSPGTRKVVFLLFWLITVFSVLTTLGYYFHMINSRTGGIQQFVRAIIFIIYFSKLFAIPFLIIDDVLRFFQWSYQKIVLIINNGSNMIIDPQAGKITRSEFLTKTSLIIAAIPLSTMTFGMISNAYDYRIRRQKIILPDLPRSFDGIRIAQISDIHSGSFYNKTAVMGGVDMLMAEKPDVVFFTGDLVNNKADEVNDYFDVFEKVIAPLGVYSILGNHDYGDYTQWPSLQAKAQNLENVKNAHQTLGWKLLMNENYKLTENGDQIAIIGIENWSAVGRFQKYGKIEQAMIGTDDCPVKLLLSHDPSQWEAQVLKSYPDIDISFAGHTHGMQFGVEIGNFKWSPVQYIYKQWAGLYQENDQYLYVNRGYGFIGYPGRVGILPEITICELIRG